MPCYTHRRCTVNLTRIFLHAFWYTRPSFTDTHLKDFHHKAQLFVHTTYHFYRHLFCLVGHVHRPAIYLYYMFSTYLQFPWNAWCPQSRRVVLLLVGIKWMRLPGTSKIFFCKNINTYFTLHYRIPCISMQGSYILVGNFLQKQLYFHLSGWSSWNIS
jgi:hypothetical protein